MNKLKIVTTPEPCKCIIKREISDEQGNNQRSTYNIYFDTNHYTLVITGEHERIAFEEAMNRLHDAENSL